LAEAYISRAVDLNPNNPETISEMGDILTYLGRAKEAIEWLDRAKRVDPFFEPAWYWWVRGLALYLAGRYDDAVSAYERSTARTAGVAAYIGACHAQAGRLERAKAIVSAALVERPELTVTWCMLKSAFKNPTDREHVISGLRSAGLPE
jgi:tetratricopeptide (TPR) repeat protein